MQQKLSTTENDSKETNWFESFYDEMADKKIHVNTNSMLFQEAGTNEDRYQGHAEIGSGGLKQISRAYDRKTGRYIAYACLRNPEQKELHDPFLREARLTGSLHHPNIIPVYDMGLGRNNEPYFIMEFMEGRPLSILLKEHHRAEIKATNFENLIDIYLKICDAVAYAHSRNILHLDLKPDNIQIGEYGEVRICDWGLAKIISTSEDVTTSFMEAASNPDLVNPITFHGSMKGTPGYMAPEQVTSASNKTYTTDIYGLGAILYCILTGQPPFKGELKQVLEQTRRGKIIPPNQINPNAPTALSAVAMKALRLDPEQRYQRVEDLALDIRKYTDGYATSAENAGAWTILRLLYQRHKTAFAMLFLTFIFIAAISIFYLTHLSHSRRVAVRAQERAELALAEVIEKEKVVTELQGTIGATLLDDSNQLWKKPLQSPPETKKEFQMAQDALDQALKLNPDDAWVRSKKAYLCFLMQRYNEALDYKGALYPLAEKYGKLKQDEDLLNNEQFKNLATEVMETGKNHDSTLEIMLLYDYAANSVKREHPINVLTVLGLLNPDWEEPVLTHSKRRGHTLIGGKGLRNMTLSGYWSSHENLLRTLEPKRIIFTETDFEDLRQLISLHLGALDISHAQISSLDSLRQMRSLIELTIRKDQFSEEELKKIPQSIKVKIQK